MEKCRIIRSHRVGTVTFGMMLILFGVLFMAHIFVPWLSCRFILRLWPLVFIFLGIEVLAGSHHAAKAYAAGDGEKVNFIYDKTAIFLTVCLTFFAMVLAVADYALELEGWYIRF